MKHFLFSGLLLLLLSLRGAATALTPPTTGRPLAEALNPNGTLKAGANGSFDARQFRMSTAPDGRPVFRPAGTTGAGDERWQDGFGLSDGVNGEVVAVVRAGTDIYIGGSFMVAGNAPANRVAKWNGTAWSSLGTGPANGVSGVVRALAVAPNGDVYVGGGFAQAGGIAVNQVARWDGTAWSSLGTGPANGVNRGVYALAVAPNGDVYAGGDFTQAGGVAANRVARWDGTAWSSLGTGLANGVDAIVRALAVAPNGDVYAGGEFREAGGRDIGYVGRVARWDGTAWYPLGNGLSSAIPLGVPPIAYALVIDLNGNVYVGGFFSSPASNIAKWNGTAWSSVGGGMANGTDYLVYALALASNGDLYAAGAFTRVSNVAATRIASWNGTMWSPLGSGVNASVSAVAIGPTGKIYVGGSFTATGDGSKAMNHFGVYDPSIPLATTANATRAAPAAQLYPNPAHGTATLRLPAGAPRQPLTLRDALGRTVRRYPAPAGAEAVLDLRGLPAGTYVVRCGEVSQRLVVE